MPRHSRHKQQSVLPECPHCKRGGCNHALASHHFRHWNGFAWVKKRDLSRTSAPVAAPQPLAGAKPEVRVLIPAENLPVAKLLHEKSNMTFRPEGEVFYGKTTGPTALEIMQLVHTHFEDAHWTITMCPDGKERLCLSKVGEAKAVADHAAGPVGGNYGAPLPP